jgi:hypothetical protein
MRKIAACFLALLIVGVVKAQDPVPVPIPLNEPFLDVSPWEGVYIKDHDQWTYRIDVQVIIRSYTLYDDLFVTCEGAEGEGNRIFNRRGQPKLQTFRVLEEDVGKYRYVEFECFIDKSSQMGQAIAQGDLRRVIARTDLSKMTDWVWAWYSPNP